MIHAITFPDYPGVSQLRTETPVLLYRSPDLLDTKKRTFTTFFKLIFLGEILEHFDAIFVVESAEFYTLSDIFF